MANTPQPIPIQPPRLVTPPDADPPVQYQLDAHNERLDKLELRMGVAEMWIHRILGGVAVVSALIFLVGKIMELLKP